VEGEMKLSINQLKKMKIVLMGGDGSGNFGHSGRPGKVGGSQEKASRKIDNIKNYPKHIKDTHKVLSHYKAFKDLEPPELILNDKGFNGMQFGKININTDGVGEKTQDMIFSHEFAHYADYKKNITSTKKYKKAFAASVVRAKELLNTEIGNSLIGDSVNALTKGKLYNVNEGFSYHSKAYFSTIENAAEKEFFAYSVSAHVFYDPNFMKTFPEMSNFLDGLES